MSSRSETARKTHGRTLDHAAGLYDLLSPLMMLGSEARIQAAMIRSLDLRPGLRVVDVGCATGHFTRDIARLCRGPGAEVVGIDAAERMIERARRSAAGEPGLRFEAALAEQLPFPDESLDRAASGFFFHHVDGPLKRRCLDEMHRVLKPGAKAVIADVDIPTHWFGSVCAWSGYVLFRQDEIRENIRGELRNAFSESRFREWCQVSHHGGYVSVFALTK